MKKEVILLVFILMLSSVSAQLADSAWPTFKGNAQRTGLSPYDTSHVDGTIKWKFKTEYGIEGSPAIGSDGTIYIGSHDGYLYALEESGQLKWKFKIGTPKYKEFGGHVSNTTTLSTPAIASDGTIYITSRDQLLLAINPNGTEKWQFPIGLTSDNWDSPVIGSDGTIYVTSSPPWEDTYNEARGGIFAITPDGKEKWYYESDTRMFNSPTLGKDGTIYVAFPKMVPPQKAHKLVALNKDGSEKWVIDTELSFESSPTVADDGTVYVGSFSREKWPVRAGIYAAKDGKILWHFNALESDEVLSTPSIGTDGTIYFGANDGYFYAVNPDGKEKWHYKAGETIESSPAIGVDGTIYFGVNPVNPEDPVVFALNPDGTVKWSFTAKEHSSIPSSPAIGKDGTVYIGSWDSYVYAFGSSEEGMEIEEEVVEPIAEEWEIDYVHQEKGFNQDQVDEEYAHQAEALSKDPEECIIEGKFIGEEECRAIMDEKFGRQGFFSRLIDWFRGLFR